VTVTTLGVGLGGINVEVGLRGVKVGAGEIVIVGVDVIKGVAFSGRVLQATIIRIEAIQKHCRITDFGSIGSLLFYYGLNAIFIASL
jgi:hypothetical protein